MVIGKLSNSLSYCLCYCFYFNVTSASYLASEVIILTSVIIIQRLLVMTQN